MFYKVFSLQEKRDFHLDVFPKWLAANFRFLLQAGNLSFPRKTYMIFKLCTGLNEGIQ